MPSLTISIINYRTKELTEKCLRSILEKKWQLDPEIVVVDNASKDGSLEYLKDKFS
ncbi:MAG: glycosyltransferase family 2 protein, partial [Candidatus Paceibacterales bacterium]